ncbi:ParB/RepB/Spo0J family partition protein [Nocardia sp. NPDC003482]|uniref:ParB/RepB/Spo0J family partition protein n=1 Tax=Nocardia sp. NPDC004068 TaxID=3364303 RepID=UPI0036B4AFB8
MSQAKKGGLGRGLAALIPTGPAEVQGLGSAAANAVIGLDPIGPHPAEAYLHRVPDPSAESDAGAVYREVPADQIEPNPKQPRSHFDPEALDELVHSIREFGLMQPIVVRQLESSPTPRYQLVMGERRWRACQKAGLETIPAIVRETEDGAMLRDALLENIHRVQLNPLEEGAAYQQLLEEFDVTHEELATRIGRSRPFITNMIRLLKLPVELQGRVASGVLSAGHARALLGLEAGAEAQIKLAERIVAEGLSVRSTEEAVLLANKYPEDGDGDKPKPAKRKPIQAPGIDRLAERLANSFDTRVAISAGQKKGKIVIEFGDIADLERIVTLMDPNR